MNRKSNGAYSLIEVVVSSAVLGLVAASVASVTMHTSRLSYANVYETTAHMVAQGYAEQIKAIHFHAIRNALEDPSTYDIPTESLMLGAAAESQDLKIDDPLIFGVPMSKEVVVDIEVEEDGSFVEKRMQMEILVTGEDMSLSTACWDAIEIKIQFSWQYVYRGGPIENESQVKFVKTNVSEY